MLQFGKRVQCEPSTKGTSLSFEDLIDTRRGFLLKSAAIGALFALGESSCSPEEKQKNPAEYKIQAPSPGVYEIPLECPAGSELVRAQDRTGFSPDEINYINSAWYLWQMSVGEQDPRLARMREIPKIPLPMNNAVLDNSKAAYIAIWTTKIDPATGEQSSWRSQELFAFHRVHMWEGLIGFAAAIGHEAFHGTNQKDVRNKNFGIYSKKEMEAFAAEYQDLERIHNFLETSSLIEPDKRLRNLEKWRLAITENQLAAGRFYFHYQVWADLWEVAEELGKIQEALLKQSDTKAIEQIFELQAAIKEQLRLAPGETLDESRVGYIFERFVALESHAHRVVPVTLTECTEHFHKYSQAAQAWLQWQNKYPLPRDLRAVP